MLKVSKEFKELIQPLDKEDYLELEQSIVSDGCREPIVTWSNYIVDGHKRYDICTKHNKPFKTTNKYFEAPSIAKVWIITNQLKRKDLNAFQRGELVLIKNTLIKIKSI